MFYVDPGYLMDHPHERHPAPIPGIFDDPMKTHQFRIQTHLVDSQTLLAKFQYYDKATALWSDFVDRFQPTRSVDILIDIAADLEGFSSMRGMSLMFPHAVASVQTTAVSWSKP